MMKNYITKLVMLFVLTFAIMAGVQSGLYLVRAVYDEDEQLDDASVSFEKDGFSFDNTFLSEEQMNAHEISVSAADPKSLEGSIVIPSKISNQGITYKVTAIGSFVHCNKITSVTIPKTVKSIEDGFFDCGKLKSVTIKAKSVKLDSECGQFMSCPKLVAVKGMENVLNIPEGTFFDCKALASVTLGSKVNEIGKDAFRGCKNLKNITIKSTKLNSKNIKAKAFNGLTTTTVITVPKAKMKSYRTLLVKKGLNKSVKVRA